MHCLKSIPWGMVPSLRTLKHLKKELWMRFTPCILQWGPGGRDTVRLLLLQSFWHKYLQHFKSLKYWVMLGKHTSHKQDTCTITKACQGSTDISFGNWSCQLNQIISWGADPEVLMKNGNKRQLFSLRTLSPPLCERALSNASFSWAFACISSPPGTATLIGQTDLSSLEL